MNHRTADVGPDEPAQTAPVLSLEAIPEDSTKSWR